MSKNMYNLPEFSAPKIKKNQIIWGAALVFIIFFMVNYFPSQIESFLQGVKINIPIISKDKTVESIYTPQVSHEQAVINVVKEASLSVVSIIITKNLPIYEQQWIDPFGGLGIPGFEIPQYIQKGTKRQEVGGGSGFIVSEDGLILTNKHVVLDKKAEYTVFTNDGQKFSAKVLARDPIQDIAIIKIEQAEKFKAIKLGDSSGVQVGQSSIAIGNALGEFRNTVSVGVISGLERTIAASGQGGFSEILEDIIQTDAAINSGNSGGPLLNLKGEVIGINTAMVQGAEAIGFAIPINRAKRDIEQVLQSNKIVYPFLGVRYVVVNEQIKEENKLPVDYGAWVRKGDAGEPAVTKDSAADKAGIKSGDIILEFNGEKITQGNSMSKIITKYNSGDKVTLKVLRSGKELSIDVILGERSE